MGEHSWSYSPCSFFGSSLYSVLVFSVLFAPSPYFHTWNTFPFLPLLNLTHYWTPITHQIMRSVQNLQMWVRPCQSPCLFCSCSLVLALPEPWNVIHLCDLLASSCPTVIAQLSCCLFWEAAPTPSFWHLTHCTAIICGHVVLPYLKTSTHIPAWFLSHSRS